MKPENKEMQEYLKQHGIKASVKRIDKGSLRGTWRLYNSKLLWDEKLSEKLRKLGFRDFDGNPLHKYSGNGGLFSVFARIHNPF